MRGYYSVFNPRGEKIADCGIERDAVTLIHSRNRRWDGHYFTFNPLPGDIIDVNSRGCAYNRYCCEYGWWSWWFLERS